MIGMIQIFYHGAYIIGNSTFYSGMLQKKEYFSFSTFKIFSG